MIVSSYAPNTFSPKRLVLSLFWEKIAESFIG